MKTSLAGAVIAVLALSACPGGGGTLEEEGASFDTPRTAVPQQLEGDWFVGSLSSIDYYDRSTGTWAEESGSGFYFIFKADGLYEHGAVITSTVYNCTMKLLGSERGTVEVSGDKLIVHRNTGRTNVTNNCGREGVHEMEPESTVWTWRIELDENGVRWLVLKNTDGLEDRFRPWDQ
jgi:hypothetical protein